MKYIHIRNIEKFHPGYKDRTLQWGKFYFTMIQGDPEFEMIHSEVDKWRFIAFVMLELEAKEPIPIDNEYLKRKGFDLKKRSISLTLEVLHNFIDVVTEDSKLNTEPCGIDKDKDKEEDKDKELRYRAKPKDLQIVIDYFIEKGIQDPEANAETFYNHYEANGWYRGKTKIRSWKHCVSQWDFSKDEQPDETYYTYCCPKHPDEKIKSETVDLYKQCPKCHERMVRE